MKKIFIVCLFCVFALTGFGQHFNGCQMTPKESEHWPIKSDMQFTANFKTPITDVGKIAKLTQSLFVKDSLIDFEQWSEYDGTNTVHFSMRRGQYKTLCMGAPLVRNPVVLDFSIVFDFAEGEMMMTFTDFSSKVYAFVDGNSFILPEEKMTEADKEVFEEYKRLLMSSETYDKFTTSNVGRFLFGLSDADVEKINSRKEKLRNTQEQFARYIEAQRGGHTRIITLDNLNQFSDPLLDKFGAQIIERYKTNKFVLGVTRECWERYFAPIITGYFREIAQLVNGDVTTISVDGVVKYEKDSDGYVRPVDPKEKKKWIKENRTLF